MANIMLWERRDVSLFYRNKLEAAMKLRCVKVENLAKHLGINRATFYKKLAQRSDFTRSEVQAIKEYLQLSAKEVMEIFYG
jgi:DNA-binding NtrC family response regulator